MNCDELKMNYDELRQKDTMMERQKDRKPEREKEGMIKRQKEKKTMERQTDKKRITTIIN